MKNDLYLIFDIVSMKNTERNQTICALYKRKFSCRQLGTQFELSFQRIHQILEENNIRRRRKGHKRVLNHQKTLEIYKEYLKDRKIIQNH